MKLSVYPAQMDTQNFGNLWVNAVSAENAVPIQDATVSISYTGVPDSVVEQLTTDIIGRTESIELPAPPIEYSMEPSDQQPYSEYNIRIEAPGYETIEVNGAEILPEQTAIQEVQMNPIIQDLSSLFVIPPHTLFGDYPPKIAESEIKTEEETGEIVLSEVVVPEFMIVHDGPPTDQTARNYWVRYRDYIKNVACSEIYATWPEATIRANVLAIQSFALNRVFTEWYRNKRLNFTITSSTAFDQKWMPGRNIFESISRVVDSIFADYLSRPNVIQPILTQYCDGNRVQCPNWMTQWGSKYLGDQGYTPIQILRYYYGDNMNISRARIVAGVPASWPGVNLTIGSRNDSVRQIQNQLNTISNNYPLIPRLAVDGIFGPRTAESVRVFQSVFGLPPNGIVDYPTWYKISEIFVGVSRMAG